MVSAGGLEDDEPLTLLAEDVDALSPRVLRQRLTESRLALQRQQARLAHLRSSRSLAQQVIEAEGQLRESAERTVECLEAELSRLRSRNSLLADQLHARDVQISRIVATSGHTPPASPE